MEMNLLKNLFCMTGITNLKTVNHKNINTAVAQQHEGTMKSDQSSHKCDVKLECDDWTDSLKNWHRTCIDSERTAGFVIAACVCEICATYSYGGPYSIKKVLTFLQWVQETDLLSKFVPRDNSWILACESESVL